ncbi:MAG: hypothetical protein VYA01_06500, partial [Bacteroidota bacterium]|nr:hypothetical protein [Bacteroidota bacterium]
MQTVNKALQKPKKKICKLLALLCTGGYAMAETVTNTGANGSIETTIALGIPQSTEVEAVSYGDGTSTTINQNISASEMIWMKKLVRSQKYDSTGATTYLLPVKTYSVCVISGDINGAYLAVENTDFIGKNKGQHLRTVVEVSANGAATSGDQDFFFISSDAENRFAIDSLKFFDIEDLNPNKAHSFNLTKDIEHSIVEKSALGRTAQSHKRVLASPATYPVKHYAIVEESITADSNRTGQEVKSNGKNFQLHQTDFAENTCGSGNGALINFAVYLDINEISNAQNDVYSGSIGWSICK